ncbi:pyrroloquinoline quinone biosynthesis protein PqqB [Heyndrickxia sporothermodurans]|uniref:pyrroloquinoline quinone biosynthesis protein PqqB n=1 Tax=Heyndrickxia sporothermodurans TaxID=46224 RepID=UPI000825AFE0|nr:pyrroloquinoline quinone biosynthesis protein PqqB [Heyndrickxia sporothermodurans]
MRIRVLGTAAGGGFPQWNCACPNCRDVREGDTALTPLLQSSLAISANEKDWYLINAGPDVTKQIESFEPLHAGPEIRETPLAGVILTDAQLDHTIGLLSLREGSRLTIYGTEAVKKSLHSAFPVFPMLKNYCSWEWQTLYPEFMQKIGVFDEEEQLTLIVETVPVSRKPPLYIRLNKEDDSLVDVWEVGLVFHNKGTGKRFAYFPTLENISPDIEAHLRKADVLMIDGTFWSEDELTRMGATNRNAKNMGHLPISGLSGTAQKLASFPAERKILVHINNSNPILRKDSRERYTLEQLGFEIAYDGMEVEV